MTMAVYKALAIPSYYRRNWNAKGEVITPDTKLPNYIGANYVTYQYKVRKVTSGSTTLYQFKKN